jgi:hypothetical protein
MAATEKRSGPRPLPGWLLKENVSRSHVGVTSWPPRSGSARFAFLPVRRDGGSPEVAAELPHRFKEFCVRRVPQPAAVEIST